MKKVLFEGKDSKNELAFKFYDAKRVVMGKPMEEHLKFSMSYWHTLCAENADMFGRGTIDKSFGKTDPIEMFKAKADFAFELMEALSINYYCFHDIDLAPEGETLEESFKNFDIMVEYVEQLQKKYNKKLLWGTANCFTNPMFMVGAGTSANADVFAVAAAKIKKAIDATIRLGGTGYVFWGGREGYDTLLNTNLGLEKDNLAKLLTMSRDYGRANGFKGDFFIEPKPKEPTKHQYDFDCETSIGFLRKYNLLNDFKLNIEANHATLAQHTFQHELRVARTEGVLGSLDANQGDMLLGWDTDEFPMNVYDATLCMYEVLKNGGLTNGGVNFDSKTRRASNTFDDILISYIHGMDTYALGLLAAAKLIEDGRIDTFVEKRYSSFNTGIGKKIVDNKTSLEDLFKHALTLKEIKVESGKQEYLESVLNQVIFTL